MLFIEGQCPHCNERRGFKLFYVSDYVAQRDTTAIRQATGNRNLKGKPTRFHAGGVCPLCGEAVLLGVEIDDNYLFYMRDCITNQDKTYNGPLPKILCVYPEPVPPYSHPALPEAVSKDFVELQSMLKQGLQPHWIVGGCRSVLETAVKELGGQGNALVNRIDDLKSKAIVSGVLADWAHGLRCFGNDAVHDRAGTPEEAAELVEFTKLFLQYTIEFPARVEEMRNRHIAHKTSPAN
jgi:Zn ribbon nucleic-acid-binding protein